VHVLEKRLRQQAEQCANYGSPLMEALLIGAADDLRDGGVVADLLAPHADDPAGSVPSLRFAGAMHRLVLERKAPELALHYPSVGGTAPVRDLWSAAERACREHLPALRELLKRTVQTNEVGRSAALFGALLMVGGPIRLLEIGASAGLNLRCDAFAYALSTGRVYGDMSSPLRLVDPWGGSIAAGASFPEIVERSGCDPNPIDPSTLEGRLTLTSYVWADQIERLERLRAALKIARLVPAVVVQAGALEFLTRELAELPEAQTTVVWHSVIWQYVDPDERTAIDALLEQAGARATESRRLVRVSLEPQRVVGSHEFLFQVHIQSWPGGERVLVANASGHGPPVVWNGASLRP
jgi:hypothetical protein